MSTIGSGNEKMKKLKKLQQKKIRHKENLFLVENAKIIWDAFKWGFLFEELYVTEKFLQKNKNFQKFVGQENLYFISEKVNKSFSSLKTPAGVCAVYKIQKQPLEFSEKILYLNGISDPGNLGTILRTALAFEWSDVVLDEDCVDLYNPKTVQAAKDAIFKLKISFDKNQKVLKNLKKKYCLVVSDLGATKKIEKVKKQNICLIMGGEADGVSSLIKKLADEKVKIKISSQMESLNVAICAAILMYEINKKPL